MNREIKGAERRQAYYADAATWAGDVHGSLRASRRVAWIVAAAACVVAVLEAIALVVLMPLKSVQPYSAVIGFRYTGAPMRMEDRFVNPLGFQATSYRRDAETTGALPSAAAGIR